MSDKEKSGGLHTAYRKKTYIGAEALKGASEQLLRRAKSIARSEVTNAAAKTYGLTLTPEAEESGAIFCTASGELVDNIASVKVGDIVTPELTGAMRPVAAGNVSVDYIDSATGRDGSVTEWFVGFRLETRPTYAPPSFVTVHYSAVDGSATATVYSWSYLAGITDAVPTIWGASLGVTKNDSTGIAGVLSANAAIGVGLPLDCSRLKVGDVLCITRVTGDSAAADIAGRYVISRLTGGNMGGDVPRFGFDCMSGGECYGAEFFDLGDNTMGITFTPVADGGMPVVDQTGTEVAISPGVLNRWGEVESLTVTFAEGSAGRAGEYCMEFVSGATATTLSLPAEVKFPEDPVIEANMRYQLSVVNNVGLIVGVEI